MPNPLNPEIDPMTPREASMPDDFIREAILCYRHRSAGFNSFWEKYGKRPDDVVAEAAKYYLDRPALAAPAEGGDEIPDDVITLLMEYTRNSKADVERFIGAAKLCGYVLSCATPPPSQADGDMQKAIEALEIAIGYTALVAKGVGNMPILKDRAQSDCEIIGAAIDALRAPGRDTNNKGDGK